MLGRQVLGCQASEPLASFFPPSSMGTRWGSEQPVASKTADRASAPKKTVSPRENLDS
jgi:hypothetical protein